MKKVSLILSILLLASLAMAQDKPRNGGGSSNSAGVSAETILNGPARTTPAAGAPRGNFAGGVVLWDNGSLVNSPGTGPGGADESLLQDTSLGMGSFGFSHSTAGSFRVADDFTVPAGGWSISDITFFAYQTGSTTTSTMNTLHLQIWNGNPADGGSSVVWGDLTTNVLGDTSWSGIYRGIESAPGATNRPIMANVVHVNTTLPPGTYWLDWRVGGSLASGPWAPPITQDGVTATGDAIQFDGSTWTSLVDVGQQGLPFIIEASITVPTLGDYALYSLLGLLVLAGLFFVRKSRLS